MFAAHMDEIGFMVKKIEEDGRLLVCNVGWNWTASAYNTRVVFRNGIYGVVSSMKNIEDAHNDPNALFIDIGAKSKEDALKYVHVGSVCGYCGEYLPLANDLVCSKTFDDRVGCFQLIEALRENDGTYPNDIYYVFTVQEEVGCRGSKTTAAFIKPDIGIAVDVTPAHDYPCDLEGSNVVGGGVGTGLVGLLGFTVLAVFVASLMIGRSPEYLGKKLGPAEMRMAVVIVVAPALAILLAASVLVMSPASAAAVGTPAPFGFTELLYAATSAGGNNGSGLSGLSSNTPLINVVLGVEMLFARLAPLAAALVLAGNLAQRKVQATGAVGLSTSSALFAVLLLVIIVLIGALSLLPAFALGPLAEQFMGAF